VLACRRQQPVLLGSRHAHAADTPHPCCCVL
jgi:hypothetical protein